MTMENDKIRQDGLHERETGDVFIAKSSGTQGTTSVLNSQAQLPSSIATTEGLTSLADAYPSTESVAVMSF